MTLEGKDIKIYMEDPKTGELTELTGVTSIHIDGEEVSMADAIIECDDSKLVDKGDIEVILSSTVEMGLSQGVRDAIQAELYPEIDTKEPYYRQFAKKQRYQR